MSSRSLGHRAPLLWLVLPFIAGLATAKVTEFRFVWLALTGAALTSIAALLTSRHRSWVWAPPLLMTMFCAGVASYALHRARLPTWDLLPPRESRLGLKVERVLFSPTRNEPRVSVVVTAEQHLRSPGQSVYFALALRKGELAPIRSAVISAVGVMVTLPSNPAADTFDGYLAAAGVNFRLTRGKVLADIKAAHAYYRFCARAAASFNEILGRGIAETSRPCRPSTRDDAR